MSLSNKSKMYKQLIHTVCTERFTIPPWQEVFQYLIVSKEVVRWYKSTELWYQILKAVFLDINGIFPVAVLIFSFSKVNVCDS